MIAVLFEADAVPESDACFSMRQKYPQKRPKPVTNIRNKKRVKHSVCNERIDIFYPSALLTSFIRGEV